MKSILGNCKLHHTCVVTRDLEKCKKNYAALLGIKIPETIISKQYDIMNTKYKGKAAPYTGCEQTAVDAGNGAIIEIIMPNEGPSAWNDFLNEHGEGIHHFCFEIKDLHEIVKKCEQYGMKKIQSGDFPGGHYAYVDGRSFVGAYLELLEMF